MVAGQNGDKPQPGKGRAMPNARPPTEKAAAERVPVHRYRRVVLAVGLLASVSTAWLVWRSPVLADPKVTAPLRGLLVLTWVLAGTYTWVHRPTNRFGPLLICVAGAYAVTSLTAFPERPVYAVGRLALALLIVVLAYAALAFPSGHPSGRGRRLIVTAAGAVALLWGG